MILIDCHLQDSIYLYSMHSLTHNLLLHVVLLLALAVTPLYGVMAQAMPMQHDHETVVSPDTAVDMKVMDCCDGDDGKCHGSSPCQNCTSCQHCNFAAVQSIPTNIASIVPLTGPTTLASIHGIVPPVEIRPPQV